MYSIWCVTSVIYKEEFFLTENSKIDKKSNKNKTASHGFFIAISTSIAEPSTILPLIVTHFGGGSLLVGIFAALLRGGAILVQMIAAFYAQSFPLVKPYIKKVFLIRFLAWFSIGLVIYFLNDKNKTLTLFFIGLGLFIFSFTAGFGAIYFREMLGKMFTHKYRGKVMATRQFFAGLGSIGSGALAGWVLNNFEAPYSFAYLFLVSSVLMLIGFSIFLTCDEPEKTKTSKKEKNFFLFLKNSFKILKSNKTLQFQIISYLLSYSYLLSLPFVILDAKENINLDGTAIGFFISSQMLGATLSNFIWGKLSGNGKNRLIVQLSFIILLGIFLMVILFKNFYLYIIVFFMIGMSKDGFRLAFTNLLFIIAPDDKRPVYVALQANIGSIGIFFSVLGGIILKFTSYQYLYIITFILLMIAFLLSFKLRDIN